MRKQYMDFVPAKSTEQVGVRKVSTSAKSMDVRSVGKGPRTSDFVAAGRATGGRSVGSRVPAQVGGVTKRSALTDGASVRTSSRRQPALGMIEESPAKFVRTDVPKRPLGDKSHFATRKTGVPAVKAQKVGIRGATEATKPVRKNINVSQSDKKTAAATFKTPKTPFINQGKVQKRPLSKNVYPKKVPVATKEPKGPVTIISKPEKQARIGLIITIVLTVVLGAAAGVIAFLLLPK